MLIAGISIFRRDKTAVQLSVLAGLLCTSCTWAIGHGQSVPGLSWMGIGLIILADLFKGKYEAGQFFFSKLISDLSLVVSCQMIFCPCFWLRYALAGSTWTTGRSIHRRFQEVSPVWAAAEHKSTGGLSFRVYWSCTSVHRLPHRVA